MGAFVGDAEGYGVGLPGKYVGAKEGATVGSVDGDALGNSVGDPAV